LDLAPSASGGHTLLPTAPGLNLFALMTLIHVHSRVKSLLEATAPYVKLLHTANIQHQKSSTEAGW